MFVSNKCIATSKGTLLLATSSNVLVTSSDALVASS